MSNEMINKLMKSLLAISALAILAGALFKLQHWPYGEHILTYGFMANFVLSAYEINRLRKIISKSEKEKSKVD